MRQRSFGFDPAAIHATSSSKEPTGGLGALSWRVDIRRLILKALGLGHAMAAWARPLLWKSVAVHKPLAHWPSTPIAERGVHESESGDGRGVRAQNARTQGDAEREGLACDALTLARIKTTFGSDQHGDGTRGQATQGGQRIGRRAVLVAKNEVPPGVPM